MINVGFFYGISEGNVLEHFGKSIASSLLNIDISLHTIDLKDSANLNSNLNTLLNLNPEFCFSFAGIGSNFNPIINNQEQNLWGHLKIPFISLFGDSPAHYEDLHKQISRYQIGLYGFKEHLSLRKTLGNLSGGVGLARPYVIKNKNKPLNKQQKRDGAIVFLKNNLSHKKTMSNWTQIQSKILKNFLLKTGKALEHEFNKHDHQSLVSIVDDFMSEQEIDEGGGYSQNIRLFLVSQLDGFTRQLRTSFIANILLDYPVKFYGSGWEDIDLANKKGQIFSDVNFLNSDNYINESLAQFNLSPNTNGGWHDRILRSAGAKTLCISNYSTEEISSLGLPESISFELNEESIRSRIEWLLEHRSEVVDLGISVSEIISNEFSLKSSFNQMIELSDLVKSRF